MPLTMTQFVPTQFPSPPFPPIILGNLRVRIANTTEDVIASQRLRYDVFYHEMGAQPTPTAFAAQMDADEFDTVCDHMLVEDKDPTTGIYHVVGNYRMLRGSEMPRIGRFYSESEFDISKLKKPENGNLLELGRSCVRADYRNKAVMQLLWRGIGEYVTHHQIGMMFGCASFAGSDATQHAECLSYLHHFHRAPEDICPRSLPHHYIDMNMMDKESINQKRAFMNLPVLVKGYLRLGSFIGDGAMEDHPFNTTDVSIVVRITEVGEKYVSRYAPDIK